MEKHTSPGTGERGAKARPDTILLVEDEEMLRMLIETFLVDHGFAVICAADGLEGFTLFKQHKDRIAIVLTDVHLPKMNGCTAFLEMKRLNPSVKGVFASGHIDPMMKRRLQQEGVRHFIHKPFLIKEVLDAIYELMGEE